MTRQCTALWFGTGDAEFVLRVCHLATPVFRPYLPKLDAIPHNSHEGINFKYCAKIIITKHQMQ